MKFTKRELELQRQQEAARNELTLEQYQNSVMAEARKRLKADGFEELNVTNLPRRKGDFIEDVMTMVLDTKFSAEY